MCCGTRTGVQGDLPRTSKVALNPSLSFSSLVFKMKVMIINVKSPTFSRCSVNVYRNRLLLDVYPGCDIFTCILPRGFGPHK